MRLDTALLEDLMARARLSTRERQTMRLDCAEELSLEDLAKRLGCGPASAKTFRQRGKAKLRQAQARYAAEQRGREDREQDEIDLGTSAGLYRFLLGAIAPPPHSDHGPHIGLTWTEYDPSLRMETTMCQEGAVHAGPQITVSDLLGEHVPRCDPAFNRARLQKKVSTG